MSRINPSIPPLQTFTFNLVNGINYFQLTNKFQLDYGSALMVTDSTYNILLVDSLLSDYKFDSGSFSLIYGKKLYMNPIISNVKYKNTISIQISYPLAKAYTITARIFDILIYYYFVTNIYES